MSVAVAYYPNSPQRCIITQTTSGGFCIKFSGGEDQRRSVQGHPAAAVGTGFVPRHLLAISNTGDGRWTRLFTEDY